MSTELFSRIRWSQNSYEILQGFWSEFWWPSIVSNNSDDYEILKELDDYKILDKFFQDLIRIFQEVDDYRILMKFFKDFYQNSGGQSYYPNSGILMKFWNNFDQNYLQELDGHRIPILDFKDFDQNSGVQP